MASGIAPVSLLARARVHLARIRYRLLVLNLLVVAVPLIGVSFARRHEGQLLAALEDDMIHQAQLVRALIAADATPLDAREPALIAAARDTRTRIRLLDATGAVRADSHRAGPPEGAEPAIPRILRDDSPTHAAEPPRPVEIASRPEIRRALAGRYGAATRLWGNQDRVYLFVALPILDAAGQVTGVVYVTRSTQDVKRQLFALRHWLIRVLLAAVLVTALISLGLATSIARPLGILTRRAARIAARQPVEPAAQLTRRRDELGQLARAIEAMTDELERRARDARTLAADISHEFKTPLSGIRGAAELLRDGAADEPEDRERFLAMITDDAVRLDRLVSRLLELARIEDDRGAALPVDLAALARIAAARVAVPVAITGEATAPGRVEALASAIGNLVTNAAQHAAPGSEVAIAITTARDRVRVTVRNRGPALSPAAQARVWDRFYSTRTADGGTGLGLAIVRSVALAHGGAVGVACADGVTAFWFEVRA
ncbi:MAG: HAMP domain-containing protein [Deltaproteobacteria bacterium]|nr:HAMP domain-containing protein [Deltaproteobacteria bacterium]